LTRSTAHVPRGRFDLGVWVAVWGGRIFLTAFETTNRLASTLCLDRAHGTILWRKAAPSFELEKSMHEFNSPAAPTPATDSERVVVYFPPYGVIAYDHTGKELWTRPLPVPPTDYGNSSSPIIHVAVAGDGLLFASSAGASSEGEPPYVGKWEEVLAQFDTNKDGQLAKDEVPAGVTFKFRKNVPDDVLGNNLSWRWLLFDWFRPAKPDLFTREDWKQVEAFVAKNPNNLMAIRPGGAGNIAKTHLAWKGARGIPDMPSPLWYRGRVYLVMDGGMVTSYDAKSGQLRIDRERVGLTSQFFASPVAAGGNIYVTSLPGKIAVIKAADTLEVLATNDLTESITATPAVLESKIYVRTAGHLSAFGN
jgi:outer membrane protein assembly factor BamB